MPLAKIIDESEIRMARRVTQKIQLLGVLVKLVLGYQEKLLSKNKKF